MLEDKVCMITGASRGIGKQIALSFAKEGAVVLANARTQTAICDWMCETSEEIAQRIVPVDFDVTDTKAIREHLTNIKKTYGKIDVLVNNAGVEYNELIGMISQRNMEEMFSVNVYGTIQMMQYTSRIMARQGSGSIINIASVVGVYGNPGQLVYSATKGAVITATKSAAKELARSGIRVNAVAPGLTNTEMIKSAEKEKIEKRVDRIYMGRIAEPEDIANACLFLASDLSTYVSGQILGVDGCTSL